MTLTILYTVASLSSIGIFAALILYLTAQKFKVYEDPLIADVDEILPGANCGGCGSPGCKQFAEGLVKSDDISDMFCPVGGNEVMSAVAKILGKEVVEQDPNVAVLRCQGSCEIRPKVNEFDGPVSCQITHMIYGGESNCHYGCLGDGDCVEACTFDAMYMTEGGIPVVIADKCTACGACAKACPRDLFEMRPKNKRDLKIYVACANLEKGGVARKSCEVACIGCSKCVKVCPKDAITVENFLAYIDPELCSMCRKCVPECPTNSIMETNFPVKKKRPPKKKVVKKVAAKKEEKVEVEVVTATVNTNKPA